MGMYVIQTINGQERHVKHLVERMVGAPSVEECFYPTYVVKKSYKREWRMVEKKLTPGYLFVVSQDIEHVAHALHEVPAFTRLGDADDFLDRPRRPARAAPFGP
ncbi:hypothetical protein H6A33_00005 [Collinsella tanakaei]|nr:hypothetical protein [Collinsella tanakaei]